ncbi:hypothetical protein [Microcoleus sp.]
MPYALCPMPYALDPRAPHVTEKGYKCQYPMPQLPPVLAFFLTSC